MARSLKTRCTPKADFFFLFQLSVSAHFLTSQSSAASADFRWACSYMQSFSKCSHFQDSSRFSFPCFHSILLTKHKQNGGQKQAENRYAKDLAEKLHSNPNEKIKWCAQMTCVWTGMLRRVLQKDASTVCFCYKLTEGRSWALWVEAVQTESSISVKWKVRFVLWL